MRAPSSKRCPGCRAQWRSRDRRSCRRCSGENQGITGRIEAQDKCVDDAGVPVLEGVGCGKIAGVRSPADISPSQSIDRNSVADIVARTAESAIVEDGRAIQAEIFESDVGVAVSGE